MWLVVVSIASHWRVGVRRPLILFEHAVEAARGHRQVTPDEPCSDFAP